MEIFNNSLRKYNVQKWYIPFITENDDGSHFNQYKSVPIFLYFKLFLSVSTQIPEEQCTQKQFPCLFLLV